jgi:hypothetical protein
MFGSGDDAWAYTPVPPNVVVLLRSGEADGFGFAAFDYTVARLPFCMARYAPSAKGEPKIAGRKRYLQVALAVG